MTKSDSMDYESNNVGFITADGVAWIVSYNTKCEVTDQTKNGPQTTACIAGIFDWNGRSKPNRFGLNLDSKSSNDNTDVIAYHAGGLGSSCAFEMDGTCYKVISDGAYTPVNCQDTAGADYKYCAGSKSYSTDYWSGAVKACGGRRNMASDEDLTKIASELFGKKCGMRTECIGTLDYSKAVSMGLTSSSGYSIFVWSNAVYSSSLAYDRSFYGSSSFRYYNGRDVGYHSVICKVE